MIPEKARWQQPCRRDEWGHDSCRSEQTYACSLGMCTHKCTRPETVRCVIPTAWHRYNAQGSSRGISPRSSKGLWRASQCTADEDGSPLVAVDAMGYGRHKYNSCKRAPAACLIETLFSDCREETHRLLLLHTHLDLHSKKASACDAKVNANLCRHRRDMDSAIGKVICQ